jgi:hypothetical protein
LRSLSGGQAKVILPITDPYVTHHVSLGSFATVYVKVNQFFFLVLGSFFLSLLTHRTNPTSWESCRFWESK